MEGRSYRVHLGQVLVGTLAEHTDGRLAFRMDDTYLGMPRRPVLSQSFEDDLRCTYWGRRPGELPAYFSNLLPEGRFRRVVEESLGPLQDDLSLLVALGADLPGAVALVESDERAALEPPVAGSDERRSEPEQIAFRFSLAGVQLKFSLVERAGKLTLPAHGAGGDWIVKVGVAEYPGLAENEYSMLSWARAAGFDVPRCELHSVADLGLGRYAPEGSRALAVRRYDREADRRVHQEDFMQVLGRAADPLARQKYAASLDELASVVNGLLGEDGYLELVRRSVLGIAMGNNDGHLKNWSLLYRDPARPGWAPVYDQVATVAWRSLDREMALKFAGSRDFGRVGMESFERLARKLHLDERRTRTTAEQTLEALRAAWRDRGATLPLPPDHRAAIVDHWRRVPLLRAAGPLE